MKVYFVQVNFRILSPFIVDSNLWQVAFSPAPASFAGFFLVLATAVASISDGPRASFRGSLGGPGG